MLTYKRSDIYFKNPAYESIEMESINGRIILIIVIYNNDVVYLLDRYIFLIAININVNKYIYDGRQKL